MISDFKAHYQVRSVASGLSSHAVQRSRLVGAFRVLAPRFSGDVQKPGNIWTQLKQWVKRKFYKFINFWQSYFNRLRKKYRDERQNVQFLEQREIVAPKVATVRFTRDVLSFFSPRKIFNSSNQKLVTTEYQIDKTRQGWQITGQNDINHKGFRYLIEPLDDDGAWVIKGRENGDPKNWVFKFSKAASSYPDLYLCRGHKKVWFGANKVIDFYIRGAKGFYVLQNRNTGRFDHEIQIFPEQLQSVQTDQGWKVSFVDINDFVMNVQHNTTNPAHQMSGQLQLALLAIIEKLHASTGL